MDKPIELSVVTTLYCSAAFLAEFYQRMSLAAQRITDSYEIIFVDDGSPDESGNMVRALINNDARVKLVELSRNFGHHPAALAGLGQAQGRLAFLIDVDLEDAPEWLSQFHHTLQAQEMDVVYGVQQQRAGSWDRRFSGQLFYTLFNGMSEIKIPRNLCTVRLMTREYVAALVSLVDKNLFLAGNCAWAGFKQLGIPVEKERMRNKSSYTFTRKIQMFLDAITSFTAYPLKFIFTLGMMIAGLSSMFGMVMIVRKLLYPDYVLLGYASIMVSIWFLGGAIISFVGTVGLYLSKVFVEVKGRPQYLIRKIYSRGGQNE